MAKAPVKADPKKLAADKHKVEQNILYALHKLNMYKALAKQDEQTTQAMAAVIFRDLKNIKKIADKVSVAEYFINLKKSLVQIGKGGLVAIKASGKEVVEAHKKMVEGARDIAKDKVLDDVKEFAGAHQEDDDVIISTLSRTIVILDQWTSPTWWFYALLRKYEGATWSDTLFAEIGGELKTQIKNLLINSKKRQATYKLCGDKSQAAMKRWVIARHALNKKMGAQPKAA